MKTITLINIPSMPKVVKVFPCSSGNKKRPLYKYAYDDIYGCPRRVLNGYMDIQEFIQQSADDVDFKSIGKMLVDNRDNVISHFEGDERVVDTTLMPRNIHEYEALHNKMKASFEGLPDDVKTLFANDFNVFRTAYMNGTIGTQLETLNKPAEQQADGGNKE